MLENRDTLAWLTPHAFVAREDGLAMHACHQLEEMCRFWFDADGQIIFALAHSLEHLLEICDVFFRLLAVSVVHALIIEEWSRLEDALINTPTLAYLWRSVKV